MALGGEVDHCLGLFLLKESFHRCPVADISPHKAKAGMVHHRDQGSQVSRIGQLIQTDYLVLRVMFEPIEDEVAPDESGSAGNQQRHVCPSPWFSVLTIPQQGGSGKEKFSFTVGKTTPLDVRQKRTPPPPAHHIPPRYAPGLVPAPGCLGPRPCRRPAGRAADST